MSIYYYSKYSALKANPNIEAQKETQALVAVVSKLIELPTDETPTVATITNEAALAGQLFFARAEDGDKLLAYPGIGQAILYRPSSNKIINVGPIVINPSDEVTHNRPTRLSPRDQRLPTTTARKQLDWQER